MRFHRRKRPSFEELLAWVDSGEAELPVEDKEESEDERLDQENVG